MATAPRAGSARRSAPRETVVRPDRPAASAAAARKAGERFINREISWLAFNSRVLALAEDVGSPILERAKFLAIVSQNLDEFFQVRVAGLKEQAEVGAAAKTPPDGMSAVGQLGAIRVRVEGICERASRVWVEEVEPGLAAAGVRVVSAASLRGEDADWVTRFYEDRIFPVLTPLAVDPAHPFPYISNLSLNLAVLVREPYSRVHRFARVKVPPLLPRFIAMPDGQRFVPIEEVIATHLDLLFPGMKVVAQHPFRVTRNADLDLEEDEADDLLEAIETELRRRHRFADVVRLEVDASMSEEVLDLLLRELELGKEDVYVVDGLIDLGALWALHGLDRPDLKDQPWVAVTPRRLTPAPEPVDFFSLLRDGDVFVHHPYDSFATSVEAFIEQASRDPQVLAIKQTLYRTTGPEGGIMRSLARAAEAGKQAVALVELKARFDEQSNIAWARALEKAGVHVVYGLVGLKTHAKIALVVRQEEGAIRHYVHIGTGNYNPRTATVYEDIGILSADPQLGADATELFNYLTGYSRQRRWRRLLVAPTGLRAGILDRITGEAGRAHGRITMKMNSLVDPEIIDALYTASRAGTEVDLVIRGICCLRPGVPGLSENIRVRSILGRFLEHSRIYRFGDPGEGDYLLGSADMMPRNLDRRVEVLVPVADPGIRRRLDELLDTELSDDRLAWTLDPDGEWRKVDGTSVSTHERLQELALERSESRFPG